MVDKAYLQTSYNCKDMFCLARSDALASLLALHLALLEKTRMRSLDHLGYLQMVGDRRTGISRPCISCLAWCSDVSGVAEQ